MFLALLAISLLHCVSSQCTDGCLKCDKIDEKTSVCEVCDTQAFYVPFGTGLCIKLEVENCEIPTTDRSVTKCLRCNAGYIMDSITNKCKEVVNKIDKCERYDPQAQCFLCEVNYYILESACTVVDPPIGNCRNYGIDPLTCNECMNGYYLDFSDNSCKELTVINNCLAYTRTKCLDCKPGYIVNPNYSLSLNMSASILQEITKSSIAVTNSKVALFSSSMDNCQKTTVVNCATYLTFDTCSQCKTGFFLSSDKKTCTSYPLDPITNCGIYANKSTCSSCAPGSYKLDVVCLSSTPVPGCIEYSTTVNECIKCEYQNYLFSTNNCQLRVKSLNIDQCKVYNPTQDKCETCNPEFTTNDDETLCLEAIDQCIDYDYTSGQQCKECSTKYGLSTDKLKCILKTPNCLNYKTSSPGVFYLCDTCDTNYYKNSDEECELNTVENCHTITPNMNKCTICNSKFYPNPQGTCSLQNIENCIAFNSNSNTCSTCIENHFLETATVCKEYTAKHCNTLNKLDGNCADCDIGYYINDSHDDKCQIQNQNGCKEYETNLNDCTICKENFYLTGTTCASSNQPQCKEYEDNLNECKICKENFYLTGTTCEALNQTQCKEYVDDNTNDCKECDSLFKLKIDNTGGCEAITTSFCTESNGKNNDCTYCNKGYYLANSELCTVITTPKENFLDNLCLGNTSNTDDSLCNVCDADKTPFYTNNLYFLPTLTLSSENCSSYTDNICVICKPFYFSTSSSDLCNVYDGNPTSKCKRKLAANKDETKDVVDNCKECVDINTMYKNVSGGTNECKDRTLKMNCNSYDPDEDKCLVCSDSSSYGMLQDFVTCTPSIDYIETVTTAITDCLVYDLNDECTLCKDGKSDSKCNTAASASYAQNVVTGTTILKIEPYKPHTGILTNCEKFSIDKLGKVTCSECEANYVKQIGDFDSQQNNAGTTYKESQTVPFPETLAGTCTNSTPTLPGTVSGPTYTAKTYSDTLTFIKSILSTELYFVILGCNSDYKPTIEDVTHYALATTIGSGIPVTVTACTLATNDDDHLLLQKRFNGLNYRNDEINYVPLESMINHDSCKLENQIFVFNGAMYESNSVIITATTDGNEYCIDKTDKITIVENCQVHFINSKNKSQLTDGTDYSFECLACKPGYKATFTGNTSIISACDLIDNCDISDPSKNLWMNSCQTCMDKYTWSLKLSDNSLNYHECVLNETKNCLIVDNSNEDCLICKKGYSLHNDTKKCEEMKITDCEFIGLGNIYTATAPPNDYDLLQLTSLIHKYLLDSSQTPITNIGCQKCSGSNILVMDTSTDKHCRGFNFSTKTEDNFIDNCKSYVAGTGGNCYKCETEYIYNETSKQCEEQSESNKFCRLKSNSSACLECDDSTKDPISEVCYENNNCQVVNSSNFTCEICKENFKLDKDNAFNCIPIDQNDICKQYGTDNACISCRESTKRPINYIKGGKYIDVVCVLAYTGTNKPLYPEGTYYSINIDGTDLKGKFLLQGIYSKDYPEKVRDNTENQTNENPPSSQCIDKPISLNCSQQNEFYQCEICKDGYFKTDENKCVEGTVDHCLKYGSDNDTCTKCNIDYYLKNRICNVRNMKNCKDFNQNDDKCTACYKAEYFSSSTNECLSYSVTDCEMYDDNADECTACELNVRYLANKKCNLYTKQFCKTKEGALDACVDCYTTNRYLNNNTYECDLITVSNCATYVSGRNECDKCLTYYFLDGDLDCIPFSAEHCNEKHGTKDECETCMNGYYKNTTLCSENTAKNCATKSIIANKCLTCIGSYYQDSADVDICKAYTAKNCKDYVSGEDKCDHCASGYFKNTNKLNVCELNTSAFCDKKNIDSNVCDVCKENYYLKSDKSCVEVTNKTCIKVETNTNKCKICHATQYIDQGKSEECKTLTVVPNCQNYNTTSDECKDCLPGHFLSANRSVCLANPNGIPNCSTYSDLSSCAICKETHYLDNNTCKLVDEAKKKSKCNNYSGDGICAGCEDGHSLDPNDCVSNDNLSGCLEFSSKSACSKCEPNFILEGEECTITSISDCLVTSGTKAAEVCLSCKADMFLATDGQQCTDSDVKITDCQIYSRNKECKICKDDFVVSEDGTACNGINNTSEFGLNCLTATYNGVPSCAICSGGLSLDSTGNCSIQCSAANCQVCDLVDATKCQMCNTGYHMNSELACVVNGQKGNSDSSTSLGIRNVMIMMMLMIGTLLNNL